MYEGIVSFMKVGLNSDANLEKVLKVTMKVNFAKLFC